MLLLLLQQQFFAVQSNGRTELIRRPSAAAKSFRPSFCCGRVNRQRVRCARLLCAHAFVFLVC